jgi:hypothetical protein
MQRQRRAEIINRNWFTLDGKVYWDDGNGYLFALEQHSFPRVSRGEFDRRFAEACECVRHTTGGDDRP